MEKQYQFLAMDADVLVEVGGIYGDGNVNVTSKQGIKVSIVDYDTLPYENKAQAENEAVELRKVLNSPANAEKTANGGEQTNWSTELERLSLLREKAIAELNALDLPEMHEGWTEFDPTTNRYRGASLLNGAAVFLVGNASQYAKDCDPADVIEVLIAVQKAIAERVNP